MAGRARSRPPWPSSRTTCPLYALTLDDPDAEGLTGPAGDHLPTTRGARRWRERARPRQDEDRAAAQYQHAVDAPRGRRLARLRDQQLGATRPREPAQPRLLGASPVRGGRARCARVRRRDAPLERRPTRGLRGRARRRPTAARLDCRPAAPRRSTRRPPAAEALDPGPAHGPRRLPADDADDPRVRDAFGWAVGAGLAEVAGGDRVVLTTRGRLLSNELFTRLI